MMAFLVRTKERKALERVILPLLPPNHFSLDIEAELLASHCIQKDKAAIDKVQKILEGAGLSWEAVSAEAMSLRMGEFQRLNQMLAKTEARRNSTLKAIERHRVGLGEQLRTIADQFETKKVHEVEIQDQTNTHRLAA